MSHPIKAEQGRPVPTFALARAPEQVASWEWCPDGLFTVGLLPALELAEQMVAVLAEHRLLVPSVLEWHWYSVGQGGVGVTTRLPLLTPSVGGAETARRVLGCRPVAFPTAQPADILVVGHGEWLDEGGRAHQVRRLVELTVTPDELGPCAELAVFHDIWGECDFQGHPHPELHQRNAPRLATALRALDDTLRVACTPGEPTYFGRAEGYSVAPPDLIDGLGPDLTDRL
ncbi:hypothetical protein [Streptomyces uncialis]|uniref:hypothetical protein n=1 Tax=Streptomyces uncialis TaxID=1048205 RepID=UPI0038706CD2|nr:hypothetical protein OG268_11965 [Streptomyces uncialis]